MDSIMQTPEGVAQYEAYMAEPTELTDSAEIARMAEMQTIYYYTHMFYTIYQPEMFESELDSTNTAMCYNGDFSESQVSDDHLEGYDLFVGLYSRDSNCSQHSILPLPENSSPNVNDYPNYFFDLNPQNNADIDNLPLREEEKATFDRIELFEESSGHDLYISNILKNPSNNARSLRLNRDRQHYFTNTMERSFLVDISEPVFSFWFALIFEEPDDHEPNEKPYFRASALDEDGNVIDELCFVSETGDDRLVSETVNGEPMTYRDWSCASFNLEDHIDEKVTIRMVAACCGKGAHWGYAYISNICVPCSESPEINTIPGDPIECPIEFPIKFCSEIDIDTSDYSVDSLYMEIRNDGVVHEILSPFSFDSLNSIVCFEIDETLFNSLDNQGYDVYTIAEITHLESSLSSTITSNSVVPNTPSDQNNDFLVTCCPTLDLSNMDVCDPDTLDLCGTINIDTCEFDLLNAQYTFTYDNGALVFEETINIDSNGNFCFSAGGVYLNRDMCLEVFVEVFYFDSLLNDTMSISGQFLNAAGDCINESCCPTDTISMNLSKNLCLTGTDFEGSHFEIEGSILLNQLPSGFSHCGNMPVFNNGVEINYDYFNSFGGVIQFGGMLYIPDPSLLEVDSTTGRYIVRGSMVFCGPDTLECELDIIMELSRGQVEMCTGMQGLMCMNIGVNTYQYRPPNPPQHYNGKVNFPLSVNVPYGTTMNGEVECDIDQYWFEICGIPDSASLGGGNNCTIISTGSIQQQNNEISGTFYQFLQIPVSEWNSYSDIQVTLWNNCGDTCVLDLIPVVPVGEGGKGLQNGSTENAISVFPMPFSNELIIQFDSELVNTSFHIVSADGQSILEGELRSKTGNYKINTTFWTSGTYILYFLGKGDRGPLSKILIKQ